MQNLSFQVIFLIVFTLSKSGLVHGQACSSPDLTDEDWNWGIINEGINANHSGTIIEYRMQNTVSITTESSGFTRKYIDARLESNVLTIFTTEAFANYEDQETEDQIQLKIDFVCSTSTKSFVFYQPINIANNHDPVFSEAIYEIPIKLPLHRGFDLTFYKEVMARDIDLRNNNVTFESPASSVIDVGTSSRVGSDGKTFYATLILNQQLLTLAEPFNFTIIATDSDVENPRKSAALVVIIPDEEVTYVPPPRFREVIYRGNINDIGELLIEDPTIAEDSYSENLEFSLGGDDGDLFSVAKVEGNLYAVKVSLKAPLTEENLNGKSFLTATITAEHPEALSGSTVLLIELPITSVPTTPKPSFEKSLIRGSINAALELTVEPIVLTMSSYTTDTVFTMVGDDSTTFALAINSNVLTVNLRNPLSENELETRDFYSFIVVATNPTSGAAETAVLISLPVKTCEVPPRPSFEKSLIRGSINAALELSVEPIVLTMSSYTTDTVFTMVGDDSTTFDLVNESNVLTVNLRNPLSENELETRDFYSFIVVATNPTSDAAETAVLISLPMKTYEVPQRPSFEKSLIRGSINAALELSVEPIVLTMSSYTTDTIFTMVGDDSTTFDQVNESNVLTVNLRNPLSENELETRDFYSFIVVATNPTSGAAETAVLISLPMKTCEECIECPETTECPVCPTPEPPIVDLSPTFQNQFYSFTIKSNEFGKIGDVLATSSNLEAAIEYSIVTENGYLSTRLMIDSSTGEISVREELISSYYEANVIAKVTIDGEDFQTSALVKLTVSPVTICPDGNVTVEKSLVVQYLKENEIHRNFFPSKINDCNYIIRSTEPHDKDYVSINSETNMLETISFDREDLIFNEYEVPQIQIKLKLNCGEIPASANQIDQQLIRVNSTIYYERTIDPSIGDGRFYTLTNDIDFTSDITVINIIIEDVNDNHPIFDPSTPSLVGYPEPAVANNIIPSQLAIIHATDKDAGINAKIKYTLSENNYFKINPDSGVITPLSEGFASANSVRLTIHATDNYGAENGLSSSHNLQVRRLEDKHLTIVTLRDNSSSSAEEVIGELNAESLIKMMILHSAIVPYLPTDTRQLQDGLSVLKMIVYAFGDDGEPLETNRVQSQLEPLLDSRQLTVTSYEDSLTGDDDDDEYIMWIIVVAVLGFIILLAAFIIFCMWWFKIRPYEYKTMIDEGGMSQENLREDFQDFEIESSPPAARFDIANNKRESINISGSTEKESTDDPAKRAISLLNLLENGGLEENTANDESERRERRKSQGVTFNELVERIDIETDPVRDS